nr:hypothetical protein [Bacillota bacterium]
MSRLTVVIDPKRRWQPVGEKVVEVATEEDYLRARLALREARSCGGDLTIWVTNGKLQSRFDDLAVDEAVEVRRYDARQQLAEALGAAAVPEELTETAIEALGLLALARQRPKLPDETVRDWVLRVTLGQPWNREHITADAVWDAIAALCQADSTIDLLQSLIALRLKQWSTSGEHGDLWRWLSEAPRRRAQCLVACWATADYGQLRLQWLSQQGFSVEEIQAADELLEQLAPAWPARELPVPATMEFALTQALAEGLKAAGIPFTRG